MIPLLNDPPATGGHNNSQHDHQQDHQHRHHDHRIQNPPRQFMVKLFSYDYRNHANTATIGCLLPIEQVLGDCNPKPCKTFVNASGFLAACLFFENPNDALDSAVCLWERRLSGEHLFTPVPVVGTDDVYDQRVKSLFKLHAQKLLEGKLVKKLERQINDLSSEIHKLAGVLKRPRTVRLFTQITAKKEELGEEMEGITKKLEEFRGGIKCIMNHFLGEETGELTVLKFDDDRAFNWSKIHFLMLRECRRLEDALPIYAHRTAILEQMYAQQVIVLIGETGSGKSTQLVQFLADSGIAGSGSIVCTQPRKIAAISLAKRVREESNGCYDDSSVVCYPTFAAAQCINSTVIFMTDHCLLQHLIKDKTLSGVSCIIVDEAHERSLNTDLLLALIKDLLCQRADLRLIIMSATVDATKLSEYFFGCRTFHVLGRSFPVEIKYVPGVSGWTTDSNGTFNIAPYVSDVIKTVMEIHEAEAEGAILAFLTSQTEVEWACENFRFPSAISLALHGKLSHEEQCHVFQNYPGKRKVIFATNLAETSLTIPGVKYVVDSGMVKESKFEPTSGMNVLRASMISQSSSNQRAGRAGRTSPGKCYRLYSEADYHSMAPHQEPEICRVHLGIAVLRILASGFKNVLEFDFIDAPSSEAVDKAINNLVHLGAVVCKNGVFELTDDGHILIKLGIEPRLGKIILESFLHGLRKEGIVLASVMANASSIFCRVGTDDDKMKSDSLKVQFCHHDGDLFTLLTVYKEWESVPQLTRNRWCWKNSINGKTLRRCRETVIELENCLRNELGIVTSTDWLWNPNVVTPHDKSMKKVILSSLADHIAMYSGYDRLGYEVVLSGEYFKLHPSCSLQVYGQKPNWVVFAELLSISSQYMVCVTAIDFDSLSSISTPLFDVSKAENRKLQMRVIKGFGSTVLKRFCGKSNSSLCSCASHIQTMFMDKRIGIEVNVDDNEIRLFASLEDIDKVYSIVNDALECEMTWLSNECLEKCLYREGRAGNSPSFALFGAGAEIKHLELENRHLSVDVSFSDLNVVDDKEVLMCFEKFVSGVCGFHKFMGTGQDSDDAEKWGKVVFLTPEAASKALEFNGFELSGSVMKVSPARSALGGIHKLSSFPAVKARVMWPRRYSKGYAIVRCEANDAEFIVRDCFDLLIGGRFIHCELSTKEKSTVVVRGLDKDTSEPEILEVLQMATSRRILDLFIVRGDPVNNPHLGACEEAILKEIAPFMPNQGPLSNYCHVQAFQPEPKDSFMKASITFDGRLHLEAARALQHIQGKVLPGCLPWQKVQCQQVFHSSVSCPAPVYRFIERQLNCLLQSFKRRPGVHCILERNDNGSYRVKITANATKKVAELRRPLEKLMSGKLVSHGSLTPTVLQLLFSRDGIMLLKSLQQEMGSYFLFDRHNLSVRIYGPENKVAMAEQRLVTSLLALHNNKQIDICLRGRGMPYDLMKKVVEKFRPNLQGLRDMFPGVEFTLNIRRHIISFNGKKDLKLRVEEMMHDLASSTVSGSAEQAENGDTSCPICLCDLEDCYQLEACGHKFCRSCLVDQLEVAIRGHDGFPVCCTQEGCGTQIWLTDLKSLLPPDTLEDLFRASLGAFVASSGGTYRFCPSPDCPSVYRTSDKGAVGDPFVCGACYAETCTKCHLEYHAFMSCERYKEFKDDPDVSLKEWCKGKEHVKSCPICGHIIEKIDGCNHIECRCGKHICWVCLESFRSSDDCYGHLRSVHFAII